MFDSVVEVPKVGGVPLCIVCNDGKLFLNVAFNKRKRGAKGLKEGENLSHGREETSGRREGPLWTGGRGAMFRMDTFKGMGHSLKVEAHRGDERGMKGGVRRQAAGGETTSYRRQGEL